MSEADQYEDMPRAMLLERLRILEQSSTSARIAEQAAAHELSTYQEEIGVQNTQLREMQIELEHSRDRYAELYDFAPLAYVTLDVHGIILDINLTGAALLGLPRQHLQGQPLRAFLDKGAHQAFFDHLRRCRESGRDISGPLSLLAKGGRPFPAQMTTHAVTVSASQETQLRTAITDLTEVQRTEQERRQVLLRETSARAAAEAKDRLIAMVSHELRTPLSAVLLWAKILQIKPVSGPELAHALEVIVRNAEAQRQLIDDLLDVSRIASGKMRLQMRPTEVAPIVRAAADALQPMARTKQIQLEGDAEEGLTLRVDPERLQQVLWNLISNALKFTPAGGQVSVSARRFGNELDLRVTDSGAGIDPQLLPHVFEPFRQADSAITTRPHGGLGLGLAISQQIIELHGGSIHARSDGRGSGATFVIRLPLLLGRQPIDARAGEDAVAEGEAAAEAATLAGLNVLVVEDELATRSALERLIGEAGAEVIAVDSAQAAIDVFSRRRPDLLVGDIGMPGVDGYQMMRHLRAIEQSGGRPVRALALTAFASKLDHERAQQAGFDRHLGKPIEPAELLFALRQLAGAQSPRAAQGASARPQSTR